MSYFNNLYRDTVINGIAKSSILPGKLRLMLYRLYGMKIKQMGIYSNCFFQSEKLKIGRGTWINHGCYFDNEEWVEIGNNCGVGMEVMFCTTNHQIESEEKRAGKVIRGKITIGNGSWIGTRATILPGVSIGEGCVIAAGSLVNNNCEPNTLYAGVPAKKIKELPVGNKIKEAI